MRKNFGPKTWMYPLPVLIVSTYDEKGNPNAMNAAWGGIYDTDQVMWISPKRTENPNPAQRNPPERHRHCGQRKAVHPG